MLVNNEHQKLATFTDRQLDPFGKPRGSEGAKKAGEEKIGDLKAIGVNAKSITHIVPDITLYVTTDNGTLHAIDAETGATRWVVDVGQSDFPTLSPAANDDFVAAVNGITLYVFHADDGRLAWSRRLRHAAGAGPAVTPLFVHVPMVPGLVETFHLVNTDYPARVYQSFGRAVLQPRTSVASLIWATDRGFVYVANGDQPGVRFRLETQAEVVAPPTWLAPNRILATSLDGDVYAADEFTGSLVWRFSTGEPIGHSPVGVNDDVYVITNNYNMFRLSAQSGGYGPSPIWTAPRLRKFLAASKDRLYCLDYTGRLAILDRATGGRVATLPIGFLEIETLNHLTDRIFFVTRTGLVQCFHEAGLDYPVIHNAGGSAAPAAPAVKQQGLAPAKAPPAGEAPMDADPFGGGGADPFGGAGEAAPGDDGAPKAAPDADPFGAGADPFGGAATPPKTEPAPAGDDPFAT